MTTATSTTTDLAPRVAHLIDQVDVAPGGRSAEVAGEVYEADSPQAMARLLGGTLYQTVHTGWAKPIEQASRTWRDPAFDAALVEATGGHTTTVSGRRLGGDATHEVVDIDGLRVRVPSEGITEGRDGHVEIRLPSARPGLSPGFFLATSRRETDRGGGHVLRVYARLDHQDDAAPVWRELIEFLSGTDAEWRAKICSSQHLFPRNDALVVYLGRSAWPLARPCAETLQATGRLGTGSSPFTSPITGSVACAFEPDDRSRSRRGLSFGQHRTQVLADALVRHAVASGPDDPSREPVEEVVTAAFVDANIDPLEPARNLSSPAVAVLRAF